MSEYVSGAALVHGSAAWILARLLPQERVVARLREEGVSDRRVEPVLEALDAIRRAGDVWHTAATERTKSGISDCGNSEAEGLAEPQLSESMSTSEAAKALGGCTPRRVRQLIASGELSAHRIGGTWAVNRAAVLALAEEKA